METTPNNSHKIVAVAAGVAALGAVGYLLYKATRKESKNNTNKEGKKGGKQNPKENIENNEEDDLAYKQATELKEQGNASFKKGNFKEAIECYTKAMGISKRELHFLLSNRSAAYHASGDFLAAKADALSCIKENETWSKGYFRLGKAEFSLGHFEEAFKQYYTGYLKDPKSEELKKGVENTSGFLAPFSEDFDSRSRSDNFLIKLHFKHETEKILASLGISYSEFQNIIKAALEKETDIELLIAEGGELASYYEKNQVDVLRAITHELLFEMKRDNEALIFAKKSYEKANNNPKTLFLYASALLRPKATMADSMDLAMKLVQQSFSLDSTDVLCTHTYAFLVLRRTQSYGQIPTSEIRSILADLKVAMENPHTNHMLIADSGLRLWFRLFEDPSIQAKLQQEEDQNLRDQIPLHEAYVNGLVRGAFSLLCMEPFFMKCLSEVVLTNPGLERVLAPFRNAFVVALADDHERFEKISEFVHALALQHFRNNYPLPPEPSEKAALAALKEEVMEAIEGHASNPIIADRKLLADIYRKLALISLYSSLGEMAGLEDLVTEFDAASHHPYFGVLIEKAVANPLAEEQIMEELEPLTEIPTGKELTYQEKRLCSQWDSAGIVAGKVTKTTVVQDLKVMFPRHPVIQGLPDDKLMHIFVAACGTGQDVHQLYSAHNQIEVAACEVAKNRLAYAIRQNQQLGHDVEFFYADVQNLEPAKLPRQYDLVIANSILHQFKDPMRAWERLGKIALPGGFLKMSVFSRSTIEQLAQIRTLLNSKFSPAIFANNGNLPKLVRTPTLEEMKMARALLLDSEEVSLLMNPSFQFFHDFVDFVFNPQIVGFTYETIEACVKKLGLQFVGFEFPGISQETVIKYQVEYPEDVNMTNGKNLDEFDAKFKDELCPVNFSNTITFVCQTPK